MMYNDDEMVPHKKNVLKDLVSKMKELQSNGLKSMHSNPGDSQAVSDHSANPHNPSNEEESEDKSEQSHLTKEDSMHDSENGDKKLPKSSSSHSSDVNDEHGGNAKEPAYKFHTYPRGDEHVSDEHGGNPHEPSNEEENESDGSRMDREDSMHDDEAPMHPAFAKLLAEHLKNRK